jgi:hypothetical protein
MQGETADIHVVEPPRRARSRWPVARVMLAILIAIVVLAVCAWVFSLGDRLRQWAWVNTDDIRYVGDVSNGYMWGYQAYRNGLFDEYRRLSDESRDENADEYRMDYTPLRLTVMATWAHWAHDRFDSRHWQPDYEFHRPVLLMNTICEALAAVGVFLVVRRVRWISCDAQRRLSSPSSGTPEEGNTKAVLSALSHLSGFILPTVAALLVWFNPSTILNDCWPQWDAWILPSFVLALYLSMRGWWFAAGILLAIGAMLKGQILMVAPAFLLWALASMQWLAAVNLVCGFAFGFGVVAAPWMFTGRGPIVYITWGSLVAVILLSIRRGYRRPRIRTLAGISAVASVWIAARWMGGDFSWFDIGFGFASRKHMQMAEIGTSNLASMLQIYWQWDIDGDAGQIKLPMMHDPVTMRTFLTMLYATTLLVCGIAAGIHWRRRDRRFIVAMFAPWVLSFALMPQMLNRYLFWAAGLYPMLLAADIGLTLLGVVICAASYAMMAEVMYRFGSSADSELAATLHRIYPGLGFLVLTAAAVFLYCAVTSSARLARRSPRTG